MRHRWLLLLLVVPGFASALERGFWLAGLAWLERPSEWSARRWGLKEQGGYGVLRLEVASQDPWQEPIRNRIEAEIRDLGLPVAAASLRLSRDGQGEVLFRWERRASAEGRAATPFRGVGGNALRLPRDWQAGPSTAAFRLERVPFERFEYGKQRDRHGVAWRWLPTADTRLELMAERERRQGLKPFGAMVGTTGGNARAAIVPTPIDETTQDMRLALSRGGSEQAWRMETRLSQYRDRVNALIWQHPFANVPGLPAEAGWPRAIGQAAAPPSNRALMLSAAGWRRLRPTLAVHGELMLGRHWQDRPFLPYTAHPDWLARPLVPPPRASLDGEIRLERAAGRAEWRLSESLELAVLARHERREDRSPLALFRQVPSDAAPQPAAPDARWRFRLPLDWRERALESGLTWRFAPGARVGLRLGLDETARRFAERDRTRDRFLAAEAMAQGPFDTRLSLQAEHRERRGDAYIGERPFLAAFVPEYVATVPGGFENAPLLRRPHLADRDRLVLAGQLIRALGERTELVLRWNHLEDSFDRSVLGLLAARRHALALELVRPLGPEGSLSAFLVGERAESVQTGHSFRGGANRLPDLADPGRRWRVEQEDEIDGLGIAARRGTGLRTLELSLAALRYRTRFGIEAGSALSAAPLPSLSGRMLLGSLRAMQPLREGVALVGEWRGERLWFRDPLARGLAADQLAGVLLATPEDRPGPAHVFLIALRVDLP